MPCIDSKSSISYNDIDPLDVRHCSAEEGIRDERHLRVKTPSLVDVGTGYIRAEGLGYLYVLEACLESHPAILTNQQAQPAWDRHR